ncbi:MULTISPECIES: hypothetical protein [Dyadobacter]|uniref:Uncharacterized protein n=1 Tax=Dyadobacter chenhuakuii TaxID=2909339 RepID=A0A9X1QC68_9BACT|nr:MULTISPECIES: hypothetical protein [Dyadobacter]MCE7072732.1 hypothetical protein [Dyadobacter sp. CY327]MCF2497787.1 hypothetical protein [Dyadobacter chenhuakuii]MCF2517292.1 hypothetical protein [Dyadobacter sp. CY351]
MRYIKDIPNDKFKIGLYQWNNKYIVKIESGMYEQTYKIDDYEIESPAEIERCMDESFIAAITSRFDAMHDDFSESLRRNEVIF